MYCVAFDILIEFFKGLLTSDLKIEKMRGKGYAIVKRRGKVGGYSISKKQGIVLLMKKMRMLGEGVFLLQGERRNLLQEEREKRGGSDPLVCGGREGGRERERNWREGFYLWWENKKV